MMTFTVTQKRVSEDVWLSSEVSGWEGKSAESVFYLFIISLSKWLCWAELDCILLLKNRKLKIEDTRVFFFKLFEPSSWFSFSKKKKESVKVYSLVNWSRAMGCPSPYGVEITYGSVRKHFPEPLVLWSWVVKYPHRALHSVSLAASVSVGGQRAGPYRRICLSHWSMDILRT